MKKYFYGLMIFLFMGITMQSCKEEVNTPSLETKTIQQETDMASWNQVHVLPATGYADYVYIDFEQ